MDILLSSGAQNVGPYSAIVDLSGYAGGTSVNTTKTDGEYGSFAMYLFTNGSGGNIPWGETSKINLLNHSESFYDTILGIKITDIQSYPPYNPSNGIDDIKDKTEGDGKTEGDEKTDGSENAGNAGGETEKTDAEKFRSDILSSLLFPIEEEKKKETELGDMYVKSSAHRYDLTEEEKAVMTYDEYAKKSEEKLKELNADTASLRVPVGAGELAKLMEDILAAISEGKTLAEALQAQIDKHGEANAQSEADLLWVNPESGEVTGAYRKERTVDGGNWHGLFDDDGAVMRLADDFASFLRYAVFAAESDDPLKAIEFIAHLKNKQAYADFERYISDLDPNADIAAVMELIIANLKAAGVISGGSFDNNSDSGENEADENDAAVGGIAGSGDTEESEEGSGGENGVDAPAVSETAPVPVPAPKEELEEILDSIKDNRNWESTDTEIVA